MIIEIIIFLVTSFLAYAFYTKWKVENHYINNDVKFVPGVLVFGNFFKSTFRKQHFVCDIDDVYKAFPEERYVGLIESNTPIVLIRDPELIKQITVKDFDHFTDHRQFFTEEQDPLFAGSLLMLKGEKWRDMRATLSPAFTGSKMRQMVPFIYEISENVVKYLRNDILKKGKENISEEVHIDDLTRRFTNDVILSSAFGLEVNSVQEKENEFYKTGQMLVQFSTWQRLVFMLIMMCPSISKYFGIKIFPKKATQFFKDIVNDTIEMRSKNKIERPDMIQLLMEASKGTLQIEQQSTDKDDVGFATTEEMLVKDRSTIRNWTQNELVGQAFIFYFAGFESSASVLCMLIHELALNPDVEQKLYAEVKEVHDKNEKISYDMIQSMTYMDMVVNETFRKWSPALIMDRECIKPYVLPPARPGGRSYRIEAGNIVYNCVNSVHMDPKYYPDPETFDPERFNEENKKNIKPFTFMPFGAGPRNCIGSRFALLELKILMYNLVLNFEIMKCSKTTQPLALQPLEFSIKAVGESWVKLKIRD